MVTLKTKGIKIEQKEIFEQNKTTKQQNNKTTKQQNNKTTKQQNNKTTKQQNNPKFKNKNFFQHSSILQQTTEWNQQPPSHLTGQRAHFIFTTL